MPLFRPADARGSAVAHGVWRARRLARNALLWLAATLCAQQRRVGARGAPRARRRRRRAGRSALSGGGRVFRIDRAAPPDAVDRTTHAGHHRCDAVDRARRRRSPAHVRQARSATSGCRCCARCCARRILTRPTPTPTGPIASSPSTLSPSRCRAIWRRLSPPAGCSSSASTSPTLAPSWRCCKSVALAAAALSSRITHLPSAAPRHCARLGWRLAPRCGLARRRLRTRHNAVPRRFVVVVVVVDDALAKRRRQSMRGPPRLWRARCARRFRTCRRRPGCCSRRVAKCLATPKTSASTSTRRTTRSTSTGSAARRARRPPHVSRRDASTSKAFAETYIVQHVDACVMRVGVCFDRRQRCAAAIARSRCV